MDHGPVRERIKGELAEIEGSLRTMRRKSGTLRSQHLSSRTEPVSDAEKAEMLRRDYERREKSAEATFAAYNERVEALEKQVADWRFKDERRQEIETFLKPVYGLQRCVVDNLETFEERRASILRERDRELQRALRTRLTDANVDLAATRSKKDASIQKWKHRADTLRSDATKVKALCDQLQKENDKLQTANTQLRLDFKNGESERKFLIGEVAAVKKETGRALMLIDHLDSIASAPSSTENKPSETSSPPTTAPGAPQKVESKAKNLDELKHLERLLDHQQRNLYTLRTNCVAQADESVALQRLLRDRLVDLNKELQQNEAALATGTDPGLDAVVGRLAWESRILTILYQLAFPPRTKVERRALAKPPFRGPPK